jgi:DHA1 family inner membrane transport protein
VQGAFNLANAQGAYFGGLALDAGFGWTSPTLVGSGLAASGALVALLAWAADRRRPVSPVPEPAAAVMTTV